MTSEHPPDRVERPFDQLRIDDTAVAPPTRFAAALRARVAAALEATALPVIDLPQPERSTTMSDTTTTPAPGSTTEPAAGRSVITPYICVTPATEAIDWYVSALGAVEVERYVGDDGRVGHAMLHIGGAELFLSDEYPDYDAVSPTTLGGTTVSLHLVVPDVDAVYERAVAQGARGDRPPADQPYGDRSSTIVDPFGHRWMISTPIANPTVAEINDAMSNFTVTRATAPDAASTSAPVELGYFTLPSPDTARASRFYGALFGWTTEPGGIVEGYAHVNNTRLPFGFVPADPGDTPQLYFRVDDLAAATARVGELGGTVVEQSESPSGIVADCRDDQGERFQLWQAAPGY